jgi:hypothetical protein
LPKSKHNPSKSFKSAFIVQPAQIFKIDSLFNLPTHQKQINP